MANVSVTHPNDRQVVFDTAFRISDGRAQFSCPLQENGEGWERIGQKGQKIVSAAFAEGTDHVSIAPYCLKVEVAKLFDAEAARMAVQDVLEAEFTDQGLDFNYEDGRLIKTFMVTVGPSVPKLTRILAHFYEEGHCAPTIFELVGRTTDSPNEDVTLRVWAETIHIGERKVLGQSVWSDRRLCELTVHLPSPEGDIRHGHYVFEDYRGPGSTFIYRR